MAERQVNSKKVVELCLLAGKIMLQNGAETSRVEDTMIRMAKSLGISDPQSFVMPTGIIFSIDQNHSSNLVRISERSTDLLKVTIVNSISRKISSGDLTVNEAYEELKTVEKANLHYPIWVQIAAASVASGCFLIMFKGQWSDFWAALVAGGVGYACLIYIHELLRLKFFAEFLSSFLVGLIAFLFVLLGWGTEMDKIIIGSVMPLVPGLLITNAIRDLIAGHLISGLSKGADAFLTAFAIGTGVAVVVSFF